MENPATWNEVEETVNKAFVDAQLVGLRKETMICDALFYGGFLKKNVDLLELKSVITEIIEEYSDKDGEGVSVVRTLYRKLERKGFLKETS